MELDEIKTYSKLLHEILLEKKSGIVDQIKSIKLSAIPDSAWANLSQTTMGHINQMLTEWGINTPSLDFITSSEDCAQTFRYLLEIIQNRNELNFDKIKALNLRLKKQRKTVELIFDCFEPIPELMEELERKIEFYKATPDERMAIYKSLKDFATDMFVMLNRLVVELRVFDRHETADLSTSIIEAIVKLVKLSFVISEYPPKIIKKKTGSQTGTHFGATISCLIETDNLFSSVLQAQIYFLNEADLAGFVQTGALSVNARINCKDVKKISNNWSLKNMIWDPASRQPKERKRADKITNIKAIILFRIKISANPYSLSQSFELNTDLYSDTVISVVHTNQEVDAHLTLFWDDYFRIDRQSFLKVGSFACKDSVNNHDLIEAISDYFLKQTSRKLTDSNKNFLKNKLFTRSLNGLVTFQTFSRIPMSDSEFSFGQWIFHIIKLLKVEGIIGMWKNDLIDGFVPKGVEGYFLNCSNGTFFLRFSEKNPKIGIVVKKGSKGSDAWSPFSLEECRSRSLPDRLMDYTELAVIRDANGQFHNKHQCLTDFIDDKTPDEGYTFRGRRLSRFYDENIYADYNISDIEMADDNMPLDLFTDISFDQ